jgi:hypothetical protein
MIRAVALAGAMLILGSALAGSALLSLGLRLGTISVPASVPSPSPFVDRDPIPMASPEEVAVNPTLHGIATHYDAERNGQTAWYTREGIEFYGAAGPELRREKAHEWRNRYRVIVTSKLTGISVIVHVVDFCECRGGDKKPGNDRLIDLAPAVWDALGVPLYLGVTKVKIEILP